MTSMVWTLSPIETLSTQRFKGKPENPIKGGKTAKQSQKMLAENKNESPTIH